MRSRFSPFFATTQSYTYLIYVPEVLREYLLILSFIALLFVLLLYIYWVKPKQETLFLLLLSPVVLSAAITSPVAIVLAGLGIVLHASSRLRALLSPIVPLVHPAGAVLSFFSVVTYIAMRKQLIAILITLSTTLILFFHPLTIPYSTQIAELQQTGGLSILLILLAITGMILTWRKQTYPTYLVYLSLISLAFFIQELVLLATLIAAIPAGEAVYILRKRKWNLESVKTATIYFLMLSMLFTTVSNIHATITQPPTQEIQDIAELLHDIGVTEVFLHTSQENVFFYQHIRAVPVTADITYIRDAMLLAEYLPEFILIERLDEQPNLAFVLRNSRLFIRIHEGEHSLWKRASIE